jgi:hypothetical protein
MKKTFVLVAGLLALASCSTEVRYVEVTSPPTTTETPTTTRPRPTTTLAPYKSDAEWFVDAIYEVMNGQVYVSDRDLLETGYLVCEAFNMGMTTTEVMLAMYESAPVPGNSQDLLVAVSVGATTFLCPEWSWVWG